MGLLTTAVTDGGGDYTVHIVVGLDGEDRLHMLNVCGSSFRFSLSRRSVGEPRGARVARRREHQDGGDG